MSRSVSHGYSIVSKGDIVNYNDPQRNYLAEIIEPVGRKYKIKLLSNMEILIVRRRDFQLNYTATQRRKKNAIK